MPQVTVSEAPVLLVFLAFALPISVIDVRERRIPDRLSFPCFLLVLAARLLFLPGTLLLSLWASFAAFFLFALIRAAVSGLGLGDLKLAAALGLACSFPRIIDALLAASVLGIVSCLFLRGPRTIPFAPFLCAGAALAQAGMIPRG